MGTIQQTLVVLKPDAISRSLVGQIISRLERAGLQIVASKMLAPSVEFLRGHYEGIGQLGTRKGEDLLNKVVEYMRKTPVLAMVVEGVEAVEYVRKIVGSTEPKSATPGTIRGDFAHISYTYADSKSGMSVFNLIHASANLQEAELEIKHWFNKDEIFKYELSYSEFIR
ncbi:MAG TPA: nucleoside-diphosphate kinase [Candidatus Absconditabacterales bacterium]|nr:nucleoside-diphosphate kinase [Candidatus Absconditabacterales bacterium]HOQ78633.1 nucleoside-diphosphate kinase [Candidatus Absconditabacterales bacterium]HPK27717.1 nucleoside-diphosphate kinase [Candidatus Absconditabacterales bacterium]